jgi:hypothetical protein
MAVTIRRPYLPSDWHTVRKKSEKNRGRESVDRNAAQRWTYSKAAFRNHLKVLHFHTTQGREAHHEAPVQLQGWTQITGSDAIVVKIIVSLTRNGGALGDCRSDYVPVTSDPTMYLLCEEDCVYRSQLGTDDYYECL